MDEPMILHIMIIFRTACHKNLTLFVFVYVPCRERVIRRKRACMYKVYIVEQVKRTRGFI